MPELDEEQMLMIESLVKKAWEREVDEEGDEALYLPKAVIAYPSHFALVAIVLPYNTHVSKGIEVMGEQILDASVMWVAVTSDTHYTTDAEIYNRGERLQEAAGRGVEGIGCAMVVCGVSRSGVTRMSMLPYVRDGKEVMWLEEECTVHGIETSDDVGGEMGMQGMVPQAIRRALKESENKPPRDRRNGS